MTDRTHNWEDVKTIAIGSMVSCIVVSHHLFGVIVRLIDSSTWGIIERIRMEKDGYRTPEEYPALGSTISAIVLGFRDYSKQVELALEKKLEREAT